MLAMAVNEDCRTTMKPRTPRIVVIETDLERGERLMQLLRERVDADVILARSGEGAVAAIVRHDPDLILTSMLLPCRDEMRLLEHLKEHEGASAPVLVVPPISAGADIASRRRFFFKRAGSPPSPAYDAEAILGRIHDALTDSQSPQFGRMRLVKGSFNLDDAALADFPAQTSKRPADAANGGDAAPLILPARVLRRRDHRWSPADLAWWQCTVQNPRDLGASIVNVSRTGVLIESALKLPPQTTAELCLHGLGTTVVVPARVVRSEVTSVGVGGVRYRTAAAFSGRLDLIPEGPDAHEERASEPQLAAAAGNIW
jgi:CheY-like chemotaxis protein